VWRLEAFRRSPRPSFFMSMLAIIASASATFFATAPLFGSHRIPAAALPVSPSASNIPRARLPIAFDGSPYTGNIVPLDEVGTRDLESSLSEAELRSLLVHRGVAFPRDASKVDLIELLRDSIPSDNMPADLAPREAERVDLFERVSPSVAYIQTSVVQSSPFSLRTSEYPLGAGSGFVWDRDGHIVTNYHVIAGGPAGRPGQRQGAKGPLPRRVMVKLPGYDEQVEAKVIGHEADKDLAVLKVDPAALPPLTPIDIGASSTLRVGQSVLAIGNPFGLDFTMTTGIVSALGRDIDGAGGRPIRDCVQTDAAINPGNSGGPLLDSRGRLVGVNTMIYSPGGLGANVGIGFAIPVDTVRRVVSQIIEFGPNCRPSIGVSVLPDQLRSQYSRNLRRKLEGALVMDVVPGSPAEALKLAPCERKVNGVLLGDLITAVDGTAVTQNEDLLCAMEEAEPNQPIVLTVMRGCDPKRVEELEVVPVQRRSLM